MGEVENVLHLYFNTLNFNERFKNGTLKRFLKYLPLHEVVEAGHIAFGKIPEVEDAIRYFCGICWNKIRGTKQEGLK